MRADDLEVRRTFRSSPPFGEGDDPRWIAVGGTEADTRRAHSVDDERWEVGAALGERASALARHGREDREMAIRAASDLHYLSGERPRRPGSSERGIPDSRGRLLA